MLEGEWSWRSWWMIIHLRGREVPSVVSHSWIFLTPSFHSLVAAGWGH